MDENVERTGPEMAVDSLGHAVVLSAERLETRVAELRAQVRTLVPGDDGFHPAADTGGDQSSLDRIQALELLLEQARERENRLATQTIRDQDRLAVVEAELRARMAELARLRFRCEGFEKDFDALAAEVAMAAAEAARATRLERERDEARERTSAERRWAAQDRDRAAEAEARVARLQHELEAARGQLANVTEFNRRIEAVRESPKALKSIGTPWVELQHLASASADAPAAHESREPTAAEETNGAEIVDLTAAEAAFKEQAPEERVPAADDEPRDAEAIPTDGRGVLRRLWSGRQPGPKPGG